MQLVKGVRVMKLMVRLKFLFGFLLFVFCYAYVVIVFVYLLGPSLTRKDSYCNQESGTRRRGRAGWAVTSVVPTDVCQ